MVLKNAGGTAIVQAPETALYSSMPASALKQVPDAHVLPLAEISGLLVRLTNEELPESVTTGSPASLEAEEETRFVELDMSEIENEGRHPGRPSTFACPDCGGVLWELEENGFLRFRCRIGHAYTARHLSAEQRHPVESALWSALRALEENASLYHRMARRTANFGQDQLSKRFDDPCQQHQHKRPHAPGISVAHQPGGTTAP
jgi:two-component system chemotaxis response regulator CheB